MRTHSRRSCDAGFTLIELLTVIAIIGILAAIFIPTIGAVREKAQRAVDANNLREIAKAALLYAGDNNDRLPDPFTLASAVTGGSPVHRWPGILAKNNLLTDASFFIAKNDPFFSGTFPLAIVNPAAPRNQLDTDFGNAVLAWEFVGGVRLSDPPTTPIAFTRGLQANGSWDATSGVYKDTGGYVVFLGGNIVFYTSTVDAFVSPTTGKRVTDIRSAIPLTAKIYATPAPTGSTLGSLNGTAAIRDN